MYSIIKKDKSAYFAGFTKTGKARFTQDVKKAYSATLREAKTQAGLLHMFGNDVQQKPVLL